MTEAPWAADHEVSATLAAELLARQFPELEPIQLEALGVGWDNSAFVLNGEYVVRFPRRKVAVPLLERELSVLPQLAPELPLPIPVPTLVGHPDLDYPWPFVGYRMLQGRTACRARSSERARDANAEALGAFLGALHSVTAERAAAFGAGTDLFGHLELERRSTQTLERLEALESLGFSLDFRALRSEVESARGSTLAPLARLVHGDLYARHLLVDGHDRLCGVIDWGDLHIGHPGIDLAIARGYLPPRSEARFRRAYGHPIDDSAWALAGFQALYSAVAILSYGHHVGDADLVAEGLVASRHLLGENF
jgi:aminoglycoside phosphotransferase (APT) family kinase protein